MDLHEIFENFLVAENLHEKKILVAASGGVDSRVLLEIAAEKVARKNLAVFHFNHNFRENSQHDAEFVEKICAEKKIFFFKKKLEENFSKNLEKNWRIARKNAAEKVAKNFGAKKILTAHHATDLVETMIFRLAKGTGIPNLAAFDISQKPFWRVPKSEIEKFARKNFLEFRADPSNKNLRFSRNLIRAKILPPLRKITPNLEKIFVKNFWNFFYCGEFLKNELEKIWPKKNFLPLEKFLDFPEILQSEFLRQISKKIPSSAEIFDAKKWLKNSPAGNSEKFCGGTKLKISQKKIFWN